MIKTRISKYTIGISVEENWDEKKHGKRQDLKFYCKIEKCYKCKNVFSPIIFRKDKIDVDDIRSRYYNIIQPINNVVFYKTVYSNVKYIDETFNSNKKCIEFGRIPFDVKDLFDPTNKDVVIEESDISEKLGELGKKLGVQITIQHTGLFNAMHTI